MNNENGTDRITVAASKSLFPWWFVASMLLMGVIAYIIIIDPNYGGAFRLISRGLPITLEISALSFLPALLIGLLIALACRSQLALFHNLGYFYLAVIGGIPTILMIFAIAFIFTPIISGWFRIETSQVPALLRGVIALSLVYGAIFGDVFRLSLARSKGEDVGKARSTQRSKAFIAAGITFIALLKDSSLLTFLAVPEIAQQARLLSGSTFQFRESYLVAISLYLLISIPLRLIVERVEGRAGLSQRSRPN